MFEGFLHPGLAWGALLAGVPILIHLLNKQRFSPTPWGAMRFVEAAWRRTRRRMQLENLLLLLLRAGAIALLALALARPFLEESSPLSALTEKRRDLVVVIDASASMGYRGELESSFSRARERASELFGDLRDDRGDRAWLILAGRTSRLLSWGDPSKASAILDSITGETHERMNLAAALAEIESIAKEESAGTGESAIEVHVLTDLQRNTFDPDLSSDSASHLEILDALHELEVSVRVEDTGPPAQLPPNIGVTALTLSEKISGPGAEVELRAELSNYSDKPVAGVRVALLVDGQRRPSRSVDLGAGERQELPYSLSFSEAGTHTLECRIEGDALSVDDSRALVVECPAPLRVALVNGAPSADIEEDAIGLLSAALEPVLNDSELGLNAFQVSEHAPSTIDSGELDLSQIDVLWLADVDGLTVSSYESITDRVAAGASLIISMGDRVQRERWNERAFKADGSGLLPAEFGAKRSVASRREGYWRAINSDFNHPSLAFFREERWRPLWTEVPYYDYISISPLDDVKVIASLDDAGRSPLLIQRDLDRGQVYVLATSIAPTWNRIAESPRTLVPFVHELVRFAGSSEDTSAPLLPGEAYRAEATVFPRSPELVLPDQSRRPLEGASEELGGGVWLLPQIPGSDTSKVGLYSIEMLGAESLSFAVCCDPNEGDLDRLTREELDSAHVALEYFAPNIESQDDETVGDEARGELWRALCILALAFLIGEALWAARLGRRRGIS